MVNSYQAFECKGRAAIDTVERGKDTYLSCSGHVLLLLLRQRKGEGEGEKESTKSLAHNYILKPKNHNREAPPSSNSL